MSLEKAEERTGCEEGWLTKWDIAEKNGIPAHHPQYGTLCDEMVHGFAERDHENAALAKQGIKQYYWSGVKLKETMQVNASVTKALQSVSDLDAGDFKRVENALQVGPVPGQYVLGKKTPKALETEPAPAKEEEPFSEKYKKAYASVKKIVSTFSTTRDKLEMLLESLKKALSEQKLVPTMWPGPWRTGARLRRLRCVTLPSSPARHLVLPRRRRARRWTDSTPSRRSLRRRPRA